MATLVVQTPEGVELKLELAGAGSRFAAGLLDLLLITAAALVLGLALLGLRFAIPSLAATEFLGGLYLGGLILLPVLYSFVFHVRQGGATLGKRALGLRVTSADGSPARPVQHLLRSLLLVVDVLLMVPVSLGLLLIALTPRATRLGDLAAGTVVLRIPQASGLHAMTPVPRWSGLPERTLILTPEHAARLAPADAGYLRQVVERALRATGGVMAPEVRDALVRDVASAYARRLGLPEPRTNEEARTAVLELCAFAHEHAADAAA